VPGVEQDPLSAVGLVSYSDEERRTLSILGTCTAFRQPHVALTAAHILQRVSNDRRVRIDYPRRGHMQPVTKIERHPDADIALLVSPPDGDDDLKGYPPGAFSNFVANWGLGEEFMAYGFPVEGPSRSPGEQEPTPRLFLGHFQRFFEFDSPAGYHYVAGELNIPAPAGLSGGPLFRPGAPSLLTGIVTANIESYSTLDWVEESSADGTTRVEAHHAVIRYGLAVMLSQLEEWLDAHVSHREGTAWRPGPTG